MSRCQITMDSDLYGLGVRVAVYSQIMIFLSFSRIPRIPHFILELPATFMCLAIDSTLCLKAWQGQLKPFDVHVSMHLVGLMTCTKPPVILYERWATWSGRFFVLAHEIDLFLQLALGTWAVFKNVAPAVGLEDCLVYVYFFGKWPNHGWPIAAFQNAFVLLNLLCLWMWYKEARQLYQLYQVSRAIDEGEIDSSPFDLSFLKDYQKVTPTESPVTDSPTTFPVPKVDIQTPEPLIISNKKRTSSWKLPPALDIAHFTPRNLVRRPTNVLPHPGMALAHLIAQSPAYSKAQEMAHSIGIFVMQYFWLIFYNMFSVEFMLLWNHVDGAFSFVSSDIISTGQVIQVVVGILTLTQFGWETTAVILNNRKMSIYGSVPSATPSSASESPSKKVWPGTVEKRVVWKEPPNT